LHRVPRFAGDRDLKPEDANVRGGKRPGGRLGDDRGVRRVTETGGEGAVSGALLFDHALNDEVTAKGNVQIAQQPRQEEVDADATLHIVRATAKHLVPDDGCAPRIVAPGRYRLRAHYIDVAIEDQG
jgi:hypothetical protein